MDSKKRRSSLRKSLAPDTISSDAKDIQKQRRISFSGKKSVRVFSGEEEPKAWNNSFEVSDNLNVNETSNNSGAAAPHANAARSSEQTISDENNEKLTFNETEQMNFCHQQNTLTNLSNSHNLGRRMTNDFINASVQSTNIFRIENSIDITLIDSEKKILRDVTGSDSLSFSLEDIERKKHFGEKTYEYMQDLNSNSLEKEEDNKHEAASHNDNANKIPNQDSVAYQNKSMKSDSLPTTDISISHRNEVKRKSVYEVSAMQLTFNAAQEVDKENVNPFTIQKVNQTQNDIWQMEVEDTLSQPQVNKESSTTKLRSTMHFDQTIGASAIRTTNIAATEMSENKRTVRSNIYFNQSIDVDAQTITTGEKQGAIPKEKRASIFFNQPIESRSTGLGSNLSRKTMNLNEDMDMDTTSRVAIPSDAAFCPTSLGPIISKKALHVNENMDITSHGTLSQDSVHGTIASARTNLHRKTMILHENMNTTSQSALSQGSIQYPKIFSTNLCRKTMNLNEDMDTASGVISSQGSAPCPNSLGPNLLRKTLNLNQDISTTSQGTISQDLVNCPTIFSTNLARKTIDLNENMDISSHDTLSQEPVASSAIFSTNLSRKTTNLNENMDTTSNITISQHSVPHPNIFSSNLARKTLNLNEDMNITSRGRLSQDPAACTSNLGSNSLRKTINLNEDINTTSSHGTLSQDAVTCPTTISTRKTINLNEDINTTSHGTLLQASVPCPTIFSTNLSRKTMNLSDDMDTSQHVALSQEPLPCSTIFSTKLSRKTMNLNEDMDTTTLATLSQDPASSPPIFNNNLSRKPMNLNEDTDKTSHNALPQDLDSCKKLNISVNSKTIRRDQPSKIIFRKICLPTPNREKLLSDSRQQRNLRLEKEQEQQKVSIASKADSALISVDKYERKKVNKSLNFSLESLKNVSMSSDGSSPLIPLEYKGYTLKQLNDAIESGRIEVFPNARKTPIINRRRCNIGSAFQAENEPVTQSPMPQNKSLLLEDVDIAKASNKAKYRYSQADELMLDNTSFLARAKLSDETMSHKSSKRDSTQFNDITDIFDETLNEDEVADGTNTSLKIGNVCNQNKNTNSSMCRKSLPFATPERVSNLLPSTDMMGTEYKYENDVSSKMNLPLLQQTKECQKMHLGQVQLFNSNKENIPVLEADENDFVGNSDIAACNFNPSGKTHLNKDISIPYVPTEKNVQDSKSEASKKTYSFAKNTQEDSVLKDKIIRVESAKAEDNKQMDLTGINISLTKPKRKTLYFGTDLLQEQSLLNDENIATCNFKPSEKTLYYNNEFFLENPNVSNEENNQVEESSPCLFQNPSRRTLFFETKIEEDENKRTEKVYEASSGFAIDQQNIPNQTRLITETIPTEEEEESACFRENQQTDFIETNIQEESFITNNENAAAVSCNLSPSSDNDKGISKVGLSRKPARNTLFFETKIQEETVAQNDEDYCKNSTNSEIPPEAQNSIRGQQNSANETITTNNNILLERVEKNAGMNLPKPIQRKTQLFHTEIPVDCIETGEIMHVANAHKEPLRKTLYYNDEILLENTLPPQESLLKQNTCKTNICDGNKPKTFESKLSSRRKSVYTPESMELSTLDEKEQMSDDITDQINYAPEKMARETNQISLSDSKDRVEVNPTFKSTENDEAPQLAASVNAAKRSLSRNFAKNSFLTPKKSIGLSRNSSICITPRLSLLEFLRLEKHEKEERRINHKRLAVNLTPVAALAKKQHTLNFGDRLQEAVEPAQEMEIPQFVDDLKDHSMLSEADENEHVLKTPLGEKKSRIPIPINSGTKMEKSFAQQENDSQLEAGNDNLAESIQLMRRATTFTNREEDIILKQHNFSNLEPPKPSSIYEGNPITISDVSVFFEAQRKSIIDLAEVEKSPPYGDGNSIIPIEKPESNLEGRFINLTLEDIDKTHLSLVRESEDEDDDDDDKDGTFCVHDLNEEEVQECSLEKDTACSANTLERKRSPKHANYPYNESLVCRKCKRCQETFVNETTSSTSESFVLPELSPIPDLGLERLRRLRKRPSIADVNALWQRVSLDHTIYNVNMSDNDTTTSFDSDDETEDRSSVVSNFIRKFHEDMKSFEARLLEKPASATVTEKLPFVLRLDALLRKNCTNWIFDYQTQFRGILRFTHKKLYTFTLVLTFDAIDPLGHEINLKSIRLEKGLVPKKNWKPIDFVLEFQLKLNLPFNMQGLCKGSSESEILQTLQEIDHACLEAVKIANELQLICFSNQASISMYTGGGGVYVRKIFRQIVNRPNTDFKYVKKTEIQVELLNLTKLSFKDILFPQLHHFREEVHLLPTGLQFLREFLPNALDYLKNS